MRADFLIVLQFREDLASQLLAQLHAPLVKSKDVPDHALGEDLMFIERDELTQIEWSDLPEEEGIGGTVARKLFERLQLCDLVGALSGRLQLRAHFFPGLTIHEGLGLGKEVGQ